MACWCRCAKPARFCRSFCWPALSNTQVRKYFWAIGAAVQGFAALGMAAAAVFLPGQTAAWVIVTLLLVLAVARSACSANYKDILARTVEKGTRGKVSGSAGTVAASAVFAFAVLLSIGWLPREPLVISGAIALAGCLWLLGAATFSILKEPRDKSASDADVSLTGLMRPLRHESEFRYYIATRAQLVSTALAPPFLVMLGNGDGDTGFGNLGLLVLASSIASIASSYVWGALSDWSSRQTLMLAGALSGVTLTTAASIGFVGDTEASLLIAASVFVSQIAYQGARAGRKTHLTDMDSDGHKAVYAALSNTLIGALLLLGGTLGALADAVGTEIVLAILAGLSFSAIFSAYQLSEVQTDFSEDSPAS